MARRPEDRPAPPPPSGGGRTGLLIVLFLLLLGFGAVGTIFLLKSNRLEQDLANRESELRQARDEAQKEKGRLEDQIAARQREIASRDERLAELEEEKRTLDRNLQGRDGRIKRLERDLKAKEGELEAEIAKRADYPDQITELEARVTDRDRVVANVRAELAERQKALEETAGRLAAEEGKRQALARQLTNAILHETPVLPPEARGETMPLIDARILEVKEPGDRVLFDAGRRDGLPEFALLSVCRGEEYLGKVFIVESGPELSTGRVVARYQPPGAEIRPGDRVTNRLTGGAALAEQEFRRRLAEEAGDPIETLARPGGPEPDPEALRRQAEELITAIREGRVGPDDLTDIIRAEEELELVNGRQEIMREAHYIDQAELEATKARLEMARQENLRLGGPPEHYEPGPYDPPPRPAIAGPSLTGEILEVRPIPILVPDPAEPDRSKRQDVTACVINLGRENGLVVGQEFEIFRGEAFVCRVVLTRVEDGLSVAQPLPEWYQQAIEAGDEAVARD